MLLLTPSQAIGFVRERQALFERSSNPFARSAWLVHFIEQIARPDWTIAALESDDCNGVMLLYSQPDKPHDWLALTNYYASLYSPLAGAEGDPDMLAAQSVRQLSTRKPHIASVRFAPLESDSLPTRALERALAAGGWYSKRYFAHGNWFLPALPFDEYLKARDSRLRNTLTRKARKFPGELRIVSDPADVNAAMDAYESIYARSWKRPEPYPDFVRGWARICAERGWLRLGLASVNGAAVAAQFWFTVDSRAYLFKLAYDEQHGKWSAGTLLTALLMRHSLDVDRVTEVDFLTGDDPYKAAWMPQRRERIGIIACNKNTVGGLARAALEFAGDVRRKVVAHAG